MHARHCRQPAQQQAVKLVAAVALHPCVQLERHHAAIVVEFLNSVPLFLLSSLLVPNRLTAMAASDPDVAELIKAFQAGNFERVLASLPALIPNGDPPRRAFLFELQGILFFESRQFAGAEAALRQGLQLCARPW